MYYVQLLPINCPSAQAKQVPFKVEQQESCCLPADSLDGETSQGNRVKLPDLLPTGFFHPLTAAGSSLKPKGVPGNLLQIISLFWEQAPRLHSRHIGTCLPEVK